MSRFDRGTAAKGERASGAAASSFDGNHQRRIVSWLFPSESWRDDDVPHMLDELMVYVEGGHLAWVCFPRAGYRFPDVPLILEEF